MQQNCHLANNKIQISGQRAEDNPVFPKNWQAGTNKAKDNNSLMELPQHRMKRKQNLKTLIEGVYVGKPGHKQTNPKAVFGPAMFYPQ